MQKSKSFQVIAAFVIFFAALGFLRYRSLNRPRPHTEEDNHKAPTTLNGRQTLTVAFLPVTCHLTCPVTDYASKTSTTGTEFDAMRFGEFPSIVEALKSKKLLAGFVTVPLAMKMVEQGAPVKICCLGHRDGSEITTKAPKKKHPLFFVSLVPLWLFIFAHGTTCIVAPDIHMHYYYGIGCKVVLLSTL